MSTKTIQIKVLLVDDSSFMRMLLSDIVSSNPNIVVVDTAINGKEAVEKCKILSPDVVLLDMTMADYDGMYAIKHIMNDHPVPIVILSSIRTTNPDSILEALEAGAFDFIDKPVGIANSKIRLIEDEICGKIILASKIDKSKLIKKNTTTNTFKHTFVHNHKYQVLAIGASTGGTGALEYILMNLPENLPIPVIIVQHMPVSFIQSFAHRLNIITKLTIKVAQENEELKDSIVYIVPGHTNTIISKTTNQSKVRFEHTNEQFLEYNNPSINSLFSSIARVFGEKCIGIILTGMGRDGTLGLTEIFEHGGLTIAQDQKSSIVFGMPKSAFEAGVVKNVVSLADMPGFIVSALD